MVILYSSIMLLFWLLRLKFIFNTQIYLKYIKKTNFLISLFGFRLIIFTIFYNIIIQHCYKFMLFGTNFSLLS